MTELCKNVNEISNFVNIIARHALQGLKITSKANASA